jgi:hypothetical protein
MNNYFSESMEKKCSNSNNSSSNLVSELIGQFVNVKIKTPILLAQLFESGGVWRERDRVY